MSLFRNSYIKLAIVGSIIICGAAAYWLTANPSMSVNALPATTINQPDLSPATDAGTHTSVKATSPKSTSAPNCQRGNYSQPVMPTARASEPGLHQNVAASTTYAVYGNTVDETNNQIAKCTPVDSDGDRFAASTDYALNWAFSFQDNGDGLCHVTAASVSINIGVIYPSWQPTFGAAAGLNASWQRFITNLAAHENGHVNIDQAGAAQLLADLQNFSATDCNTIVAQATAKANADIQAIDQTNDNYDAATNHGQAQGAVLK
jgi:predicted secreted Zn-dependent protease